MVSSIAYPSIIKRQSSSPSITSNSVLWRDTDDNVLYFSDGATWQQFSSSSEAAGYEQMISQLALEMLRLSAEGTLTAPDYDNMFVDYFADADGQDGTIDTGNTTAHFLTDTYYGETEGETYDSNAMEETNSTSFVVIKTIDCQDTTVSKVVYDWRTNTNGWTATFKAKYTYTDASTAESSEVGNSSGSWTSDQEYTNPNPSKTVDKVEIIGKIAHVNFRAQVQNMEIYGYTPASTAIQTNAQSLGFAPAYFLVHVKDKTLAGTGAITFDISFDGGSTWDSTGNSLDEKTGVVDGSGKNMVVKFNVNGNGSGNTAELKDYEVVLWSS